MSKTPRRLMLVAAPFALGGTAIGASVPSFAATAATSAAAASSAAMATSTTYPVQVTAANGTITIPSRPTAIVSLSPTATEMLYAIGAGSQVKAVDSYSDFPKSAPRTKLNAEDPNVEAIVAYKPDLVVVAGDTTGLTAQLAKFGIPVLSDPAATDLSQEYQQFDELGQATDHQAQAKAEVTKIKGQIALIVANTPKHSKPITYYFELDQTYYSETSSTFIGQVLGLLGMKSIADAAKGAASSGGYPQLSAEFIIKANPDYIFLADTICCGQNAHKVAKRPGWAVLSAVKGDRVVGLNDDIASRWGPRIVNLLRTVANAVKRHGAG
jgi:iron complex transport system substrate-binding protein